MRLSIGRLSAVPALLLVVLLAYGSSADPPRWIAWILVATLVAIAALSLRTLWAFRGGAALGRVLGPWTRPPHSA